MAAIKYRNLLKPSEFGTVLCNQSQVEAAKADLERRGFIILSVKDGPPPKVLVIPT
jgi:hypothetical protein